MVESRSMVNGASPGPAPAAHARASNSRLTRSSWRTWPHLKLRRKVPRVGGALTVPPRVRAVPPVRNALASSMQSPPASAEATSVIILSPVVGPARRIAQVQALLYQLGKAEVQVQGGWKEQAGVGHQAVVVEQGLFIFRVGLHRSRISRESGNPYHPDLWQLSRGKTV